MFIYTTQIFIAVKYVLLDKKKMFQFKHSTFNSQNKTVLDLEVSSQFYLLHSYKVKFLFYKNLQYFKLSNLILSI